MRIEVRPTYLALAPPAALGDAAVAETAATLPDGGYVNNFADPQQRRRLAVRGGRGARLAAAMKRLVEELRAALPAAFERDENRARREALDQQFKQKTEAAFGALQ